MSSHTVPSVHLAWPETCERFVWGDSGDSLAARRDHNVILGSLPGLGAQRVVDEAPLLWCAGVVHRFAELALSRDQATALSVTGASWTSASQRTWFFS